MPRCTPSPAADLAKALACKGSTKFGEDLSREGMAALLHEWACCQFPKACTPTRKPLGPLATRLAY